MLVGRTDGASPVKTTKTKAAQDKLSSRADHPPFPRVYSAEGHSTH